MTYSPPWSDAEVTSLRVALHVDGKTYAEAGAVMGRSYHSVRSKARNLGYRARDGRKGNGNPRTLQHRDWWHAEDRTRRLRSAAAAGHRYSFIAIMLGTTRNAIAGRLYRLGLSRPSYKPPRYAFNEIGPRDCCWPYGDPDQTDFRFCGARTQPDRPYCAAHMALAYLPPR